MITLRTQLDKHIEMHKLGLRWVVILTDGVDWQCLGTSFDFADLVEDCRLNSTFDRTFNTIQEIRFFKEFSWRGGDHIEGSNRTH